MRRLLAALLFLAAPALAQGGPSGIAFVQAPEQSWGLAMGDTPDEAFAAAVAMCVAGGALAEDCLLTNWCNPAGWSVDIFAQHVEGIHWHEVHCGLPTREAGERAVAALCDPAERPWLIVCELVQVYDPEGTPMLPY